MLAFAIRIFVDFFLMGMILLLLLVVGQKYLFAVSADLRGYFQLNRVSVLLDPKCF